MSTTTNKEFVQGLGIILLAISVSSAAGLGPQNTAINLGAPLTYLNCSESDVPSEWFVWTFTNFSSGTTSSVATGCEPFNYDMYDVDDSTSNSCNLIIRDARPSHAGLYTCSPGGQMASSAQFIVLEASATCSSTKADKGGYTFSCGVGFTGNIAPVVTWYDGSITGKIIPSTPFNNGSYVSASFLVPPGASAVPSNLCQVNFNTLLNSSPGQATNAPIYTSSCEVTEFSI